MLGSAECRMQTKENLLSHVQLSHCFITSEMRISMNREFVLSFNTLHNRLHFVAGLNVEKESN